MDLTDDKTPDYNDSNLMFRLRELLLEKERAKVQNLESEVTVLETEIEKLHQQILQTEEAIIPTVTQQMGNITKNAVDGQRHQMAKALGPIIGEATRYQIQESRDEMIEALFPIMGEAVSRAVAEAMNDLRKKIDQQIRPNRNSVQQEMINRMRGVDSANQALRNALPFAINQLFLIQHDSGLVLEFVNQESDDVADHDLVSSMLTAIRSFVNDSFSPEDDDDELHEIQFGDERVLIESGTEAYVAAVISGIEPSGFRSLLRVFVNELHIQHKRAFAEYDGDEDNRPDVKDTINEFIESATNKNRQGRLEKSSGSEDDSASKMLRTTGIIVSVLLLSLCIFYSILTYRLLPYAFGTQNSGQPSNVPAVIAPDTVNQQVLTKIIPSQPRWSHEDPDFDSQTTHLIESGSTLTILRTEGDWAEVEWADESGEIVHGWIDVGWINLKK